MLPIIGPRTLEQLADNLASTTAILSPEVEPDTSGDKSHPGALCTSCTRVPILLQLAIPRMEMVGLGFFGFVLLVGVVSSLIAMSNTTWPSEEEGIFNLRQRRSELRSVDRKPRPAQRDDSAKSSAKRLTPILADGSTASLGVKARDQKSVNSGRASEKERVGGIMKPTSYYCFEFQSLRVVRIIMRENHLQSLPVVDFGKRVIGTVTMRDIAAFQQNQPN